MSGALLSLVANTLGDPRPNNVINTASYKKSNHTQEIINNNGRECNFNHLLIRDSDTISLEYLVFKYIGNNRDDLMTELNNIINDSDFGEFELTIGGTTIWKNTLSFFMKLNKPRIINNAICIKLPYDMFIDEIPLISLMYHEARIFIRLNRSMPDYEISICYNQIYYDQAERARICQQHIDMPIQYVSSYITKLNNPANIIRHHFAFDGLSKGYFLEGDIDDITGLKLKLNGHDYLDYNNITLNLYGIRIHEKLLFLPFHPNVDYKNISYSSFNEGLHHGRVDTVVCIINFNNNQTNFAVHSLEYNKLMFASGMGGLYLSNISFISIETESFATTQPYANIFGGYTRSNTMTWTTINKIINLDKNNECPISYISFEEGCTYCTCSICEYNFDADTLKQYFSTLNNDKKCGMCRSEWTNYTVYTNSE